jgi:hypothetical protein
VCDAHIRFHHVGRGRIALIFFFADDINGLAATGRNAETAADTAVKIDFSNLLRHLYGAHLTPFHTDLAADAIFLSNPDIIIGMYKGGGTGKPFETLQYLAAIATAKANI